MITNHLKQCTKCKEIKPIEAFGKGRADCKQCRSKVWQQWFQMNRDERLAYGRQYRQTMQYQQVRLSYAQTEERKRVKKLHDRQYREINRNKRNARFAVGRAIKSGKLPKVLTLPCANCGNQAQECHHESYAREHWLTVTPLCKICHAQEHWDGQTDDFQFVVE